MRLRRRPQGRIPLRVAKTHWTILLGEGDAMLRWEGEGVGGMAEFVIANRPTDDSTLVTMLRNHRVVFHGTWGDMLKDIHEDLTLW